MFEPQTEYGNHRALNPNSVTTVVAPGATELHLVQLLSQLRQLNSGELESTTLQQHYLKVGLTRLHPMSRDKMAKSVTKWNFLNNFPRSTLSKNWLPHKVRLMYLECLCGNGISINSLFEELFKKFVFPGCVPGGSV